MDPIGKSPVAAPVLIAGKIAMACCWAFPLAGRYEIVTMGYDSAVARAVGVVLYAAGTVLAVFSFASLGRSLSVGLPESETELRTGGVYRISRNPIYLAAFLLCAGSCCVAIHPLNLFLFAVTMTVHHRIILREEKFLEARFGRPYIDYRNRVRRYIGRRS